MSVIGYTFGRVPDGLLFSNADDRAKVLYAVLTRWADLRPGQHPTRSDLAAALDCSVDSMDRAKNELVERGYLDVRERFVEGTKIRDANDWHLLPGPATESDPISWGSRKGAATMTRGNSETAGNGSRKGAARGSRKGAATLSRREEQDLEKENLPPAAASVPAIRVTSRDLLAEHLDALGHDLATKGQLAATIKRLLERVGVPADEVRAALALMRERGLTSPNVLSALVDEVRGGGKRKRPPERYALNGDHVTPPAQLKAWAERRRSQREHVVPELEARP